MRAIALFPGQGAQSVGMGRALADAEAVARSVFDEVDDALGERLSSVIFDGPEDELRRTANAQPALLATSIAAWRAFERRIGAPAAPRFAAAAGHSLGEYSALVAAGALDLAPAARLLRLRGEAMQAAVPAGEGAMAAILGLPSVEVEAIARDAARGGEVCEFANDNSDSQAVISGHARAIERALEAAKAAGGKRSQMLSVSAPFHCSLMKPAAERLAAALAETEFRAPSIDVICNVAPAPERDPDALRSALIDQVAARVRWRETMEWAAANRIDAAFEFGAGKVLTGLARRALRGARTHAIGDPDAADAAARAFAA